MVAMELLEDVNFKTPASIKTSQLSAYCRNQRLSILASGTFGNVIRVLLPLVIPGDQLQKGLSISENGLKQLR